MRNISKDSRLLPLLALSLLLICGSYRTNARPLSDDNKLNLAGVLLGPCGLPGAEGPTGIDDDFTNRSIATGFAIISADGATTAGGSVVFRNTVSNVGAGDDAFIITAPSTSPGFRIEISTDDGEHYSPLDSGNYSVILPVSYRASSTFFVRVTAPSGLEVLTGFDTIIRARSTIEPAITNETINRLYTGFIRLAKTATIVNATGTGGPADAVPGAEIEFAITYSNISSAIGIGSSLLTAHNLVINENGNAAPNNWGATTEQVVGASDNHGGYILGDRAGSTSLSDIILSLEAGQSGVFKYRRRIK